MTNQPTHSDNSTGNQPRLQGLLTKPMFWFVVALAIRLLYLLEQGGSSPLFYQPLLDEKEAVDSALQLLSGGEAAEPYFKAPGYSWILAAVIFLSGEAWPWVIRAIQHAAGAVLVSMAAWLAGTLAPAGRGRDIAIGVSGFLASVYAPMIRLENNISLDFWVVAFQSAMLCYLCGYAARISSARKWNLIAAGTFAAAAWIIRPTLTVVVPVLILWVGWINLQRSQGLRQVLVQILMFCLPLAVVMSAVVVRNQVVSGEAMLMPWQGGFNFYHSNRPGATGRYFIQDRVAETDVVNPTRYFSIVEYQGSQKNGAGSSEELEYSALNNWWFQRTVSVIKADPMAWLHLMFRKGVYLFSDKEVFNYEEYDLQKSLSPILRHLPGRFGVVFPLALASLALVGVYGRRRKLLHLLNWAYLLGFGAGVALYYVSGRMRMPLAFPVIALAGCGTVAIVRSRGKRRVIAVVLTVAGCILSWGDWWGVRSESMAHADLARMSNAAWYRGRYDQALDLAERAEELSPDYPVLPRLKGQALYGLGRLIESQKEYRRSVQTLGDETSKRNLEIIAADLASSGTISNEEVRPTESNGLE